MASTSRLKPTQRLMTLFTLILLSIVAAGGIWFGMTGFFWALSSVQLFLVLMHLPVLVQTRNPVYLVFVLFYLFAGLTFLPPLDIHPWHEVFAAVAAVFLVGEMIVLFKKKINWRYRDILELAAKPVQDSEDGYTSRPFPSGRADFSRSDAAGLGRFLLKNVIAYPFFESDRVVLVIPRYMWSYLLWFRRSYDRETYVAFTDDGRVNVRIDRWDYQAYKQELTFDRLCASLGSLFKEFMSDWRSGRPEAIFVKLNSV